MSRWPLLLVLASMAPLAGCGSRPFVVHDEHAVHGQLDLTLRTGPSSTKVDELATPDGAGSAAYDHEQGRLTVALRSDGAEPSQVTQVTQVTFSALVPQTSRGRATCRSSRRRSAPARRGPRRAPTASAGASWGTRATRRARR